MLYFGYGSNLNHNQMKKKRCVGSIFIQTAYLKDYDLSFCHPNKNNVFGYANVFKKKGSKVPGAVWKITKKHEKILDLYEQFPTIYIKDFFYLNKKKVMFYKMKLCSFKRPSRRYMNLIHIGYNDCQMNLKYLKDRMSYYKIPFKFKWKL